MEYIVRILAAFIVFCIGCIIIDMNRFVTRQYKTTSSKVEREFHFVFISDLHNKTYGRNNRRLMNAIKRINPEAVFIAGDMLTSKPGKDFKTAVDLLEQLIQRYPVFYGNGNHEQRLLLYPEVYGSMGADYEEALSKMGIKRLVNEKVTLKSHNIIVKGLEMDRCYYKRFTKAKMQDDYLESVLGVHKESSYEILIAHNPDYFRQYAEYGADLVLSGHVHGGICKIPFLGGVISPSLRIFPKYDGGIFYHKKKNKASSVMILSRGLGTHTLPIRLWNPGELIEVTIQKE